MDVERKISILSEAVRQIREEKTAQTEAVRRHISLSRDQIGELSLRLEHLQAQHNEMERKLDELARNVRSHGYALENQGRDLARSRKKLDDAHHLALSASKEVTLTRSLHDVSFTIDPEVEAAQKGASLESLLETEDDLVAMERREQAVVDAAQANRDKMVDALHGDPETSKAVVDAATRRRPKKRQGRKKDGTRNTEHDPEAEG